MYPETEPSMVEAPPEEAPVSIKPPEFSVPPLNAPRPAEIPPTEAPVIDAPEVVAMAKEEDESNPDRLTDLLRQFRERYHR
jgi:hypothetical protein